MIEIDEMTGTTVRVSRPVVHEEGRISGLVARLGSSDPTIRSDAIRVLGIMGPAAREALPELRRALHDRNEGVRRRAAIAVGRIDPSSAGFSAPVGAF